MNFRTCNRDIYRPSPALANSKPLAGYIRLHHFDQDYVQMEDPVPEKKIEAQEGDEELLEGGEIS